jgi:hypothetical protein
VNGVLAWGAPDPPTIIAGVLADRPSYARTHVQKIADVETRGFACDLTSTRLRT